MEWEEPGINVRHIPGSYADLHYYILERIFRDLTALDLRQAAQVCTTWNVIIDNMYFKNKYFNRMHQLGLELRRGLKKKLKKLFIEGDILKQSDILKLMEDACFYEENISNFQNIFGGSHSKENDWRLDNWDLKEEHLEIASGRLLSHKPRTVELTLRSGITWKRYVDIFFSMLDANRLDVKDFAGWRNLNPSEDLLEYLYARHSVSWITRNLWTAVWTVDALPRTVKELHLGIMVDESGSAIDPGLARLTECCPQLECLDVHVRAGAVTNHLPSLPDLSEECYKLGFPPWLYLSDLSEDHIQWAVDTVLTLQPRSRGYCGLFLIQCQLNFAGISHLLQQLLESGFLLTNMNTTTGAVICSPHTPEDAQQLLEFEAYLENIYGTDVLGSHNVAWFQDEDEMSKKYSSRVW